MKQTARILAILMALLSATPTHTISNRSWHCLTGLGAIGGAALGLLCYNAYASQDDLLTEHPTPPRKKRKDSKLTSLKRHLPAICSAAFGALVSGIAVRKMLWGWTPGGIDEKQQAIQLIQEQARIAQVNADQAQARNNYAQAQALIQQDIRLIEFYGDNMRRERIPAEERARRIFDGYPLARAAQYMHEAEQRNMNAANLCRQALQNAHNDQQLINNCNQSLQDAQTNIDLAQQVGAELRRNPGYAAEVDREAVARAAQQQADARAREAQAAQEAAQAALRQAQAAEQQVRATEQLANANFQKAQATLEKARALDRNTGAVLQRMVLDGATAAQLALLHGEIAQLKAQVNAPRAIHYHRNNHWE